MIDCVCMSCHVGCRPDLVAVVQDLWKSKKKGQRIEEFVADQTRGNVQDFEASPESLLRGTSLHFVRATGWEEQCGRHGIQLPW